MQKQRNIETIQIGCRLTFKRFENFYEKICSKNNSNSVWMVMNEVGGIVFIKVVYLNWIMGINISYTLYGIL